MKRFATVEALARRRACVAEALARTRACLAEALARRRVPLGFMCGGLVLWLSRPTRATLIAGFAIASLGEAIRFWAAGHLHKAREVTSSGPYRWFGHPLYLGSSVMGVGLSVACRNATVAVLIALYLGATFVAAIRSEEAFLRRSFGDRYERYRRPGVGGRARCRCGTRLQPGTGDREPRAPCGRGSGSRAVAAALEVNV